MRILRTISEIMAKKDNYSSILGETVKTVALNLEVEVCSVYIYDKEKDALVLAATHGLKKESVGNVMMRPGEGLAGRSFRDNTIINVSNPKNQPGFIYFANTGEEKYNSFLSVPLCVAGQNVGVMVLQKMGAEKFQHAVIDMTKSLSTQLANMIVNAQIMKTLTMKIAQEESSHSEKIILSGSSASGGMARGKAFIFRPRDIFKDVTERKVKDTAAELALFEKAVKLSKDKILEISNRALEIVSEADASIFHVHLLFLDDATLVDEIRSQIREHSCSAEYAVKIVFNMYHERFMKMGGQFKDKEMDLKDVMRRLIESLRESNGAGKTAESSSATLRKGIIVAEELLPSDLIRLTSDNVAGIVCCRGGATSHVAILAKALNIPALLGVSGATEKIQQNDELIIDCHTEYLYVKPEEKVIQHYEEAMKAREKSSHAHPGDSLPAYTTDNELVTLRATISLINETQLMAKNGASGVGMYRTEFFFMVRESFPTEDEQLKIYSKLVKEARNDDVCIRLLDVGADKALPYIKIQKEDNPALGIRGIRFLLSNREILTTQLRAILRAAAACQKLKILVPMIAGTVELDALKAVISQVHAELRKEGIKHCESYKLGMVLELPSAVMELDDLIKKVDFMSIGSNDLLQYSFALDRCNKQSADYYTYMSPQFLKILGCICETFRKHPEKELAICGEMSSNPLCAPLLVGAGIRDLSIPPVKISPVKRIIRAFSVPECVAIFEAAVKESDSKSVYMLILNKLIEKDISDVL